VSGVSADAHPSPVRTEPVAERTAPDARTLISRMAAAEKENRKKAAFFVYREDIRSTETLPDGHMVREIKATYEVSILEGEPYHRRISFSGRPLSPEDEAAEEKNYREVENYRRNTPIEERRKRFFAAEESRFKIDSALVVEHHDATLLGEETIGGRRCWIVETKPRKGTPKPKRRSQWSLSQRIRFWIDQESYFPIRVVAEQLYDFDNARKGTLTEYTQRYEDGVWLLHRIDSQGKVKENGQTIAYRTEQDYSDYRRFSASSTLMFAPKE